MIHPTPELIVEYVETCRDYVRRAVGVELDLSPDTLPVLDHYASLCRDRIRERPELGPLIARASGSYFGEVVRSRIPSFWRIFSPNLHDWALCAEPVFLWQNPIGVAYDAIFSSTEHDGPRSVLKVSPEDQDFLAKRLERLPPVPEHEYFTFATRFEVLEVAAEALRGRMMEQGHGGIEFDEEDYALGLRPVAE